MIAVAIPRCEASVIDGGRDVSGASEMVGRPVHVRPIDRRKSGHIPIHPLVGAVGVEPT